MLTAVISVHHEKKENAKEIDQRRSSEGMNALPFSRSVWQITKPCVCVKRVD